MLSKIYYRLHIFQLQFIHSYFISVTVTFQLLSLFQLQLTDLKYFSYCSFQLGTVNLKDTAFMQLNCTCEHYVSIVVNAGKGRLKKRRWNEVVKDDLKKCGLEV